MMSLWDTSDDGVGAGYWGKQDDTLLVVEPKLDLPNPSSISWIFRVKVLFQVGRSMGLPQGNARFRDSQPGVRSTARSNSVPNAADMFSYEHCWVHMGRLAAEVIHSSCQQTSSVKLSSFL